MKNIIILTSIFFIALSSCTKNNCNDNSDSLPTCIEEKVTTFKNENTGPGNKIESYIFENEIVYLFDYASIADGPIEVYDASCNHLGTMGGFVGQTEINGIDFYDNATLLQTIWNQ